MIKIFNKILLIIIVIIISSCREDDRFHHRIYLNNASDYAIYAYLSMDKEHYLTSRCAGGNWYVKINQNSSGHEWKFDPWESYFNCIYDTLFVHIADANKVDSNDTTNLIVRYELSIEDLQELKWHLSFPPSIEMKYIHMTPSFDELFVEQ